MFAYLGSRCGCCQPPRVESRPGGHQERQTQSCRVRPDFGQLLELQAVACESAAC